MILVLTVVGVLFFIASPPEGFSCTGFGSLLCQAIGAEQEDLLLTLQNRTGQDILINPFTGIAFDKRYGYAISKNSKQAFWKKTKPKVYK